MHLRPRSKTQQSFRKKPFILLMGQKNSKQKSRNFSSNQNLSSPQDEKMTKNRRIQRNVGQAEKHQHSVGHNQSTENVGKRKKFFRVYSCQSELIQQKQHQSRNEGDKCSSVNLVSVLKSYLKNIKKSQNSINAMETPINKLSIFQQLNYQQQNQKPFIESMTTRPPQTTQHKKIANFFQFQESNVQLQGNEYESRKVKTNRSINKIHIFSKEKQKDRSRKDIQNFKNIFQDK